MYLKESRKYLDTHEYVQIEISFICIKYSNISIMSSYFSIVKVEVIQN